MPEDKEMIIVRKQLKFEMSPGPLLGVPLRELLHKNECYHCIALKVLASCSIKPSVSHDEDECWRCIALKAKQAHRQLLPPEDQKISSIKHPSI